MEKIGIVIPTKGNVPLLKGCVLSFIEKVAHRPLYFYIADTGSSKEELLEIKTFLKTHLQKEYIKLIQYNWYNFAKINNNIIFKHFDNFIDHIVFCNNDIKLIDDCITSMIKHSSKENVGTVGCKLLYEDMTIQHAGQKFLLKMGGKKGSYDFMVTHRGLREKSNRFTTVEPVFGNTCGFCMIKKKLFEDIGGFNEKYSECFEDVELNVECLLRDKNNIYVGKVKAFHFESQTRVKSSEKFKAEHDDFYNKLFPFIKNNFKKIGNKIAL